MLCEKLNHITSKLLRQVGKKSIPKIQFLLLSAKTKFLNKRIIRVITNLAYISKNKSHKKKVINKNQYFNY